MTKSNSRDIAADDIDMKPQKRDIASLHGRHHDILKRAIVNVLSTPAARLTYGQIVDGLPVSSVASDSYRGITCPGHPLLEKHLELSTEVLQMVDQLYSTFDPDDITMDSAVGLVLQSPFSEF